MLPCGRKRGGVDGLLCNHVNRFGNDATHMPRIQLAGVCGNHGVRCYTCRQQRTQRSVYSKNEASIGNALKEVNISIQGRPSRNQNERNLRESAEQRAHIRRRLVSEVRQRIFEIQAAPFEMREQIPGFVAQASFEGSFQKIEEFSVEGGRGGPFKPQEFVGLPTSIQGPGVENPTGGLANHELKTTVLQCLFTVCVRSRQLKEAGVRLKNDNPRRRLEASLNGVPAIS